MKTYQNFGSKSTNQNDQVKNGFRIHWSLILAIGLLLLQIVLFSVSSFGKPISNFEFQSATAITVAANNNVYVTGYKNLIDNNTEIVTQQYDRMGKLINEVTNCNPDNEMHNDQPYKILSDKQSNIYVCGHEFINDFYEYEVVLIKYNANLDLQWKFVFYNSEYFTDEARGIAFDGAENICITGMQRQYEGRSKVFLYKISMHGQLIYKTTMPDDYDNKIENVNGLIADTNGNVYICGSAANRVKAKRFYTARFNETGTIDWKRFNDCANENFNDEAKAISFDRWGNIIVAGESEIDYKNEIAMVVKYNADGIQIWCKTYKNHNSGREGALSVLADKEGSIFVIASYDALKISEQQFTVYKINNWGVQQWARTIMGAYTDAKICSDSLLYLTGNVNAHSAMICVLSTSYGIKKSMSTFLPAKSTNFQNSSTNFIALSSNVSGEKIVACGNAESCGETNFCESNWLVKSFSPKCLGLNKAINTSRNSLIQ